MDWINQIIGTDAQTILWWQMMVRGVLVFFVALFLVRMGGKRTFGKSTSFDIVVGVMLGSTLSRTLTGNSRFFPTVAAASALVLLHFLLGKLALHSPRVGHAVKGIEVQLVKDGQIQWDAMRRVNMTEHDLREAMRLQGGPVELPRIRAAFLERNGHVSILPVPPGDPHDPNLLVT